MKSALTGGGVGPGPASRFLLPAWAGCGAPLERVVVDPPAPAVVVDPPAFEVVVADAVVVDPPAPAVAVDPPDPAVVVNPLNPAVVVVPVFMMFLKLCFLRRLIDFVHSTFKLIVKKIKIHKLNMQNAYN